MNSNIDEFIKDICDGECGEYFVSSRAYCFALIKEALPSDIFSQNLDRKLEIKIARIASPVIKKINQIDQNRFWVIYYRLCEELIAQKCSQCQSSAQEMLCIEYILDRVLNHIKSFDIADESIVFKKVRDNISKVIQDYHTSPDIELDINPKDLQYTTGAEGNYTKKILKRYAQESMDIDTIEALIENAVLSSDGDYQRAYLSIINSYIEKELLSHCDKDKKELDRVLHPLLLELLHQEKFFNYIHNHFINHRFIDFLRSIKLFPPPEVEEVDWRGLTLDEILGEYSDTVSDDIKLILRLKIGERLEDRAFIKTLYLFDYREIDVFVHFEYGEILEIKQYARHDIELSVNTRRKISTVREKLESDSYVVIEGIKREILLKLIFPDEMSAKEIGMLLGYREKQIYKKIENAKNRIKYKKELALCKEA